MGRFGLLDGLALLVLQLIAVLLGLLLSGSLPALATQPWRRWANALLLGFYTYIAAFVAHILAFIMLKHFWPLLYADHDGRRPFIALAWALATAVTVRFSSRGTLSNLAVLACTLLAAAAYYLFFLWRT